MNGPRRSLAGAVEAFRRLDQPGFMRHGRPDDHGELRELQKYMLDTSICVYIIERTAPEVERRAAQCEVGEVVMSSVTLAELHYGAAAIGDSRERESRNYALEKLRDIIPMVPFDEGAALAYAAVRMSDPKRNIRAMDKLIAAHAIALNLTLVTNNLKDFRKFRPPLRMENWAAKGR